MDLVKSQRADMFREITRLRDVQGFKTKESVQQGDQCKALEYDLQKTLIRIDEQTKVISAATYDINNKDTSLEDDEREIARIRSLNSQQSVEIVALRRDVDRVASDCYDLRKNIEGTEQRNSDLAAQVRSLDVQAKDREDTLYGVKKDIENQ